MISFLGLDRRFILPILPLLQRTDRDSCENVIVDAGETTVGEDAIYCEGQCKKWIHCCCAGLAKHEFLELKDEDSL